MNQDTQIEGKATDKLKNKQRHLLCGQPSVITCLRDPKGSSGALLLVFLLLIVVGSSGLYFYDLSLDYNRKGGSLTGAIYGCSCPEPPADFVVWSCQHLIDQLEVKLST